MATHDKQEFLKRLGPELDAIDSQLDEFGATLRGDTGMGGKFRDDDRLGVLQQRREAIRRQSRGLEDLDGEQWEMRRREIEAARDDLKRSLAKARNELRH